MLKPLDLSMTLFSWDALPLEDAAAATASFGLHHVDIGVFPDRYQVRTAEVARNPRECAGNLSSILDQHALQAADVFFHPGVTAGDLAPNHPDPARVEEASARFENILAFAVAMGCPHLTTLPGVPFANDSGDLERSAATLRLWRNHAAERGIILAVEPHIGSLAGTPDKTLQLLNAVPGLGLTLDPAHFVCAGVAFEEILPLAPLATHAHLRPARSGKLQCAMAENTIPFRVFLAALDPRRCPCAAIELVRERPLCDQLDVPQTVRHLLDAVLEEAL